MRGLGSETKAKRSVVRVYIFGFFFFFKEISYTFVQLVTGVLAGSPPSLQASISLWRSRLECIKTSGTCSHTIWDNFVSLRTSSCLCWDALAGKTSCVYQEPVRILSSSFYWYDFFLAWSSEHFHGQFSKTTVAELLSRLEVRLNLAM